jgi:hypothetical protein
MLIFDSAVFISSEHDINPLKTEITPWQQFQIFCFQFHFDGGRTEAFRRIEFL